MTMIIIHVNVSVSANLQSPTGNSCGTLSMDVHVHSPMNKAGEGRPPWHAQSFCQRGGAYDVVSWSVFSKPWLVASVLQGMHVGRAPP